jgi:hypothetical protein
MYPMSIIKSYIWQHRLGAYMWGPPIKQRYLVNFELTLLFTKTIDTIDYVTNIATRAAHPGCVAHSFCIGKK